MKSLQTHKISPVTTPNIANYRCEDFFRNTQFTDHLQLSSRFHASLNRSFTKNSVRSSVQYNTPCYFNRAIARYCKPCFMCFN